jgi:polyisoprenoid-binding protein YceI
MEITREHSAAVTPPLGRYRIDARSSAVRFRTRHMFGLAPVRGSFAVRAGGYLDMSVEARCVRD